ncbi:hypothetical protein ASG82_07605 [Mycobacterium sp. Soil538]|nr:hypothetical protein ASG82_07605 [Mycobacterium sp. Soil538]
MEFVLGVSMTSTAVSIALVEGENADGVIVEHDVLDFTTGDASATLSPSDHVVAAVLGTQEGALAGGHHLVSTGVAWTDHTEAALLRQALVARGLDDVLLVSELHAAAALTQQTGRALGYGKTALMFVGRDTATLAIVDTVDGSVFAILSQSLAGEEAATVVADMVTSLQAREPAAQGLCVVGSGVDVSAVKARLQALVAVPVVAPAKPHLALARGAALASAHAPRFDTTTIGLAYSQDSGDTAIHPAAYPIALAYDATTRLGHDEASLGVAYTASERGDAPQPSKPFLIMGSSLTAVFAVGITALAIAMAISFQPSKNGTTLHSGGVMQSPASAGAPPPAPQQGPAPVADPAPTAPPPAAAEMARSKVPTSPPPRVVRNAAPAPPAAPAAPAPAPLPPVVFPPLVTWLPPILQPPHIFSPPKPKPGHGGGRGHGGSRRGHGD